VNDALSTLRETVAGMAASASGDTPSLRPRQLGDLVRRFLSDGPVSSRRRP
jgi:hypothetical protein